MTGPWNGTTSLTGGRTLYGLVLGVVMLDTRFPRLPGDVGHAATWPFPVSYRVVRDALPESMARAEPDVASVQPFLDAARSLEADGVQAIITSCGFLAMFQPDLADAVSVPVFASPLLQVPLAARTAGAGRRVAILTAREVLTDRHFAGVGWSADDIPVVQVAPPETSHFIKTFVGNRTEADAALLEADVTALAQRTMRENADVGAVVLECANLAPFSDTVRRVTGLPVFDLTSLGMHAALVTAGPGSPSPLRRAPQGSAEGRAAGRAGAPI